MHNFYLFSVWYENFRVFLFVSLNGGPSKVEIRPRRLSSLKGFIHSTKKPSRRILPRISTFRAYYVRLLQSVHEVLKIMAQKFPQIFWVPTGQGHISETVGLAAKSLHIVSISRLPQLAYETLSLICCARNLFHGVIVRYWPYYNVVVYLCVKSYVFIEVNLLRCVFFSSSLLLLLHKRKWSGLLIILLRYNDCIAVYLLFAICVRWCAVVVRQLFDAISPLLSSMADGDSIWFFLHSSMA